MDITCISDLHGFQPELPSGDLLIVAGDLTARDDYEGYCKFNEWMIGNSRKYKKCIIISGNHDNSLLPGKFNVESLPKVEYLCDSGTEFEGLKIWGSPWTKTFKGMNPNCKAFTCDTDEELAKKWALIPDDTNILITHGPGKLMHDKTINDFHVGSESLLRWVSNHCNTLKLHVYGHVHEAYGIWDQRILQKHFNDKCGIIFVNCSYVNERYQPVNKSIRIVL